MEMGGTRMKLIDILDKKVVWFQDTDCEYYWDYKYVVELDKKHYALLNHSGSFSGWNPLFFESVDKEFTSAFLSESEWHDEKFAFVKDKKLVDYTGNYLEEDDKDFSLINIIPIEKETVDKIMKELKSND
jgi:hypothetical protein